MQEVLIDIYGLSNIPIFFNASHFVEKNLPIYYSLNIPMLMEFSPKSRISTKTVDTLELYDILQTLMNYKSKSSNSYASIDKWFNAVRLDIFHSHSIVESSAIKPSQLLYKDDKRMLQIVQKYSQQTFPDSSTLLRGIVRINQK